MRGVVQRVSSASVQVDGEIVGKIGQGIMLLLGVEAEDTESDVDYLLRKVIGLRIFEDPDGKMNLDLQDVQGSLLVISQFTLLGDARKGRRPSFIKAAPADLGKKLYLDFVAKSHAAGISTAEGIFQADMKVSLVNDGPVTILLDSKKTF